MRLNQQVATALKPPSYATAFSALRHHFASVGAALRWRQFLFGVCTAWWDWSAKLLGIVPWAVAAAALVGPQHEVVFTKIRAVMTATPSDAVVGDVQSFLFTATGVCLGIGVVVAVIDELRVVSRHAVREANSNAPYITDLVLALRSEAADALFDSRKVGVRLSIPDLVQAQMLAQYGLEAARMLALLVGNQELFDWTAERELRENRAADYAQWLVQSMKGSIASAFYQARKLGIRVHVPEVVRAHMMAAHGDTARRILDLLDGRVTL